MRWISFSVGFSGKYMWKAVTWCKWQSWVGQPLSPHDLSSAKGCSEWQQSWSAFSESSVEQQLISDTCSSTVKTDAKESTGDRKTSIANKRVSIWNVFFTDAKLRIFTITANLVKVNLHREKKPWQGFWFKTPLFVERLRTRIHRRQLKHWAMKFCQTWAILQYGLKFWWDHLKSHLLHFPSQSL